MRLLARVKFRRMMVIWAVLPLFTSCNTVYTGKHFSFPPESKPHENNWRYAGQIIVSSNQTPITKKSIKKIQIEVYDKNKTIYLRDNFQVISASIEANIFWEEFEKIQIEIIEVGNKYSKDSYNQKLLKDGPKSLFALTYQYDQKANKFKRIN